MNTFKLRILTTNAPFYRSDSVVMLTFNTTDGKYGVAANHQNMLGTVRAGEIVFREENGENVKARVSDGIIKIKNNRAVILVEEADKI